MGRQLKPAQLTTANARRGLKPGIYWRRIGEGSGEEIHLGYRKGKAGGVWLVRWRLGPSRGYRQTPLRAADEQESGTRDYLDAEEKARNLVKDERRKAKAAVEGPPLTVSLSVESYIAHRDKVESARRGREVRSAAASRLGMHVTGLPERGKRKSVEPAPLAEVALEDLSERDLLKWRDALPETLRGTTKQRLVNDLKAALNSTFNMNHDRLPAKLPDTIKRGLKASLEVDESTEIGRDNQILSDAQVARLIGAARDIDVENDWDGDVFRMVAVLAATGARFSQVARLRVRDLQSSKGRLIIPASRKGKGKKTAATPVPIGADIVQTLMPAIKGRPDDAPLLERWRYTQGEGSIRWQRSGRSEWQSSDELKKVWVAIRERAEMSNVIPYALRHSSIVRGIRANLPIRLVAALHDTSVIMIERHYGRFIADGLDELAARSVVPLIPPAHGDNVVVPTRI